MTLDQSGSESNGDEVPRAQELETYHQIHYIVIFCNGFTPSTEATVTVFVLVDGEQRL